MDSADDEEEEKREKGGGEDRERVTVIRSIRNKEAEYGEDYEDQVGDG